MCGPKRAKNGPCSRVSGRERVNLNAALNAQCPTRVHLDETDCVNAQSTKRLHEKLLIAHPEGSVHFVCENARYYKTRPSPPGWLANASCRSFCRSIRST